MLSVHICDLLILGKNVQMLDALLNKQKLLNDLFIRHAWIFIIFYIKTFLFHLKEHFEQFLFVRDKFLRLKFHICLWVEIKVLY